MQFPEGLRSLNHRDFRLFWFGQLISLVGTWMQSIGQSWLILQLTDSPFLFSLISTLQFLPVLLFSLISGSLIDRLPKRKVIIATQTTLMVLAFILAGLVQSKLVQYWHVAVLAVLLGLVNSLDMPARQAYIIEMVGKPDLMNAIALNSAMFNSARLVGPAVAGLLIAKYGIALGFFLNGISFIAVIIALFFIKAEGLPKPRRKDQSMVHEIQEGLQYVVRTPVTFYAMSQLAVVSLFVINFGAMIPLLAKLILHQGAAGFGLLMSAMGAGALTGALVLAVKGRTRPKLSVFTLPGAVLCIGVIAIAFIPQFRISAMVLAVVGFTQISFTAMGNTLLQITTPDELRGRVMSLYTLVFAGSTPIGSFFFGLITERWGAPAGWWSAGSLGLISMIAIAAWWWLTQGDRRQQTAH